MTKARELSELADTLTVDGSGNIDIGGTVTADGLTVDGNATISSASPTLVLEDTDGVAQDDARLQVGASVFNIKRDSDSVTRFSVGLATGDISFYDSLGTSQSFFWDASAETLGLGTTAPTGDLDIYRATSDPDIRLTRDTTQSRIATNSAGGLRLQADYGNTAADSFIQFSIDGSEVGRFSSDGKLGIGTTSPSAKLQVAGDMILERTDTQSETRNLYIGGARNAAGNDFAAILFRNYDNNTSSVDYVGASITAQPDGAGTDGGLLTFSVSSTTVGLFEAMRIDAGGNVLVSKTADDPADQGIQLNADGSITAKGTTGTGVVLDVRRSTGDGEGNIANFRYGNTVFGSVGVDNGDFFIDGEGANTGLAFGTSAIRPRDAGADVDNAVSLGNSAVRFSVVYAGTGSINTSDANAKRDIAELDAAEKRVAVACKNLVRKFRFNDAYAEKGEAARIHVGVIAQDVQAAFVAEGLDPNRYALFCSDTWWEWEETQPATEERPERVVRRTTDVFENAPEGAVERTRLGVRYSELLAFIIGAM